MSCVYVRTQIVSAKSLFELENFGAGSDEDDLKLKTGTYVYLFGRGSCLTLFQKNHTTYNLTFLSRKVVTLETHYKSWITITPWLPRRPSM